MSRRCSVSSSTACSRPGCRDRCGRDVRRGRAVHDSRSRARHRKPRFSPGSAGLGGHPRKCIPRHRNGSVGAGRGAGRAGGRRGGDRVHGRARPQLRRARDAALRQRERRWAELPGRPCRGCRDGRARTRRERGDARTGRRGRSHDGLLHDLPRRVGGTDPDRRPARRHGAEQRTRSGDGARRTRNAVRTDQRNRRQCGGRWRHVHRRGADPRRREPDRGGGVPIRQTARIVVRGDFTPPRLLALLPPDGTITADGTLDVIGFVDEGASVDLLGPLAPGRSRPFSITSGASRHSASSSIASRRRGCRSIPA